MSRTYRIVSKLIHRPEFIENRSTWHGALRRWQSSVVKVAIVGSGPSGCYTAKYLQSALDSIMKLKARLMYWKGFQLLLDSFEVALHLITLR